MKVFPRAFLFSWRLASLWRLAAGVGETYWDYSLTSVAAKVFLLSNVVLPSVDASGVDKPKP
jgi:hypothetical protein